MILLIGASGSLGSETCKLLEENGYKVKASTRNPLKLKHIASDATNIVTCDLTDLSSIDQALSGVDIVVASAHSLMGRGRNVSSKVDGKGHKDLIDLSVKHGVKHFVYISSIVASASSATGFLRTKYEVERYLIESGLNYTIIRATAFMEFHAHKMIGESILRKGKATIFGYGKTLDNYISVKDVAKLILSCIKNKIQGKTIEIGSPENISKTDLAILYGKVSGKTPKISYVSPVTLKLLSKVLMPFHKGFGDLMFFSAIVDEIDITFDPRQFTEEYDIKPTTLEEFVKEKVRNAWGMEHRA